MADQQRDVIEILTHDHQQLEAMFAELAALRGATGDAERSRRKNLVAEVAIELVRHSIAEEAAVYPAVMNKVSDAEAELAKHEHAEAEAELAKHEHAEAEASLKRLGGLQPDGAAFDSELDVLMSGIRQHVAKEASRMFPHMRRVFTQQELDELGAMVESVKRVAPTRPLPSVPSLPPGGKMLSPIAGLSDRSRPNGPAVGLADRMTRAKSPSRPQPESPLSQTAGATPAGR